MEQLIISLPLLIITGVSIVTSLVTIYSWIQRRRQERKILQLLKEWRDGIHIHKGDQ